MEYLSSKKSKLLESLIADQQALLQAPSAPVMPIDVQTRAGAAEWTPKCLKWLEILLVKTDASLRCYQSEAIWCELWAAGCQRVITARSLVQ